MAAVLQIRGPLSDPPGAENPNGRGNGNPNANGRKP